MFTTLTLRHTVTVPPSMFGDNINDYIRKSVFKDLEGKCLGEGGFVLSVVSVDEISDGKILEGVGAALFDVKYRAKVFSPKLNDIVSSRITKLDRLGFFAEPADQSLDRIKDSLHIFVPKSYMPCDFQYDDVFKRYLRVGENKTITQILQIGTQVKAKVINIRADRNELTALSSMM